jgi:hypothetical protein
MGLSNADVCQSEFKEVCHASGAFFGATLNSLAAEMPCLFVDITDSPECFVARRSGS